MRTLAPASLALTLVATLFAGCSDDAAAPTMTCPDGTVLTHHDVPGMEDEGFDLAQATRHCPVAPSMVLDAVPPALAAYQKGTLSWSLRNGTYGTPAHQAHSMMSQVRVSPTSAPAPEGGPDGYGAEMPGFTREHQNLPQAFNGTLTFSTPGVRYLRGYMQVRADGLNNGTDIHYWTPEVRIEVTDVQPSGIVHRLTHSPGAAAGNVTPTSLAIRIGDQVAFANADAIAHTFSFTQVPAGAAAPEPIAVEANQESAPVLLTKPGSYEVTVTEPGSDAVASLAKVVEVSVSEP